MPQNEESCSSPTQYEEGVLMRKDGTRFPFPAFAHALGGRHKERWADGQLRGGDTIAGPRSSVSAFQQAKLLPRSV